MLELHGHSLCGLLLLDFLSWKEFCSCCCGWMIRECLLLWFLVCGKFPGQDTVFLLAGLDLLLGWDPEFSNLYFFVQEQCLCQEPCNRTYAFFFIIFIISSFMGCLPTGSTFMKSAWCAGWVFSMLTNLRVAFLANATWDWHSGCQSESGELEMSSVLSDSAACLKYGMWILSKTRGRKQLCAAAVESRNQIQAVSTWWDPH